MISVHVNEDDYARLKTMAAQRRRPVAALIRESLAATARSQATSLSVFALAPLEGGKQLADWDRSQISDEMLAR